MEKQRDFGLDLTRAAAAVLVLAVHFFLNNGFYDAPLEGAGMLAGAVLRMAFMTCVPLFMTLSGYLCLSRRWERGYLRGLLPVAAVYLLAGAACLAFRVLRMGESISLLGCVRRMLDFSAAPYGWYVEMYLGLYLLMPFVNAGWNALEERGKRGLLLTMVCLTAVPPVTNLFGQILPAWWTGLYPLTYYVLGAWLREHPIRWKKRWLALGWLGISALAGAIRFVLARGGTFVWAEISDWGSLLVLGETACLFSCLSRCSGAKMPRWARACVARTAKLSLPIYLMSYITDQIIYPVLAAHTASPAERLWYLPLMTAVSLLLSGLMAQPVQWAAQAAVKLLPGGKKNM